LILLDGPPLKAKRNETKLNFAVPRLVVDLRRKR